MAVLCAAGALLNVFLCHFLRNLVGVPLFLDTILTMTLTFYGGLFWGAATGALTNLILHSVFFYGWAHYLYTLCNVAVAVVTALFVRRFPAELSIAAPEKTFSASRRLQKLMERVIVLALLSFALCVAISVLGGIFAAVITVFYSAPPASIDPETPFKLALIRRNLPGIIVEIGSRIPINILDRLVSSFAGFALAAMLGRWGGLRSQD